MHCSCRQKTSLVERVKGEAEKIIKNMNLEIRYYLSEQAHRRGVVAHKEAINGDRNFAINCSQQQLRNSRFVAYDLIQKKLWKIYLITQLKN